LPETVVTEAQVLRAFLALLVLLERTESQEKRILVEAVQAEMARVAHLQVVIEEEMVVLVANVVHISSQQGAMLSQDIQEVLVRVQLVVMEVLAGKKFLLPLYQFSAIEHLPTMVVLVEKVLMV
jgi:hypothetical protein